MNLHLSTCTILNSDLPLPKQIKFHHIPLRECWSVHVIHKFLDSTPTMLPLLLHCTSPQLGALVLLSSWWKPLCGLKALSFNCWCLMTASKLLHIDAASFIPVFHLFLYICYALEISPILVNIEYRGNWHQLIKWMSRSRIPAVLLNYQPKEKRSLGWECVENFCRL